VASCWSDVQPHKPPKFHDHSKCEFAWKMAESQIFLALIHYISCSFGDIFMWLNALLCEIT